ncbi:AGAP009071-PA [Anopheles gambiae str. PEST]|uniref:AGAP009071-PA n=1 Tax=Anopheles gambiae TaxID=7165 RepID=Q7PW70_ANOGA|nr:AGAP009071-PA [Anopheles gambiae str. PEST]
MTSVQSQEDLEARIARIKKRNEEIEKKYREAEEDRLRAMKENAMVEIKPPKDDDWPREHKYDKIDFNYELDESTLAQLEERKKEKNAFIQKIAKEYKGFAEGEGPPPDPAYSFLADVERDGEKAASGAAAGDGGAAPNNNVAPSANGNGRRHREAAGATPGQGGRGRGGKQHGHHGHHGGGTNIQRSFSTNEHDGWRSATGEQQRRGTSGRGTTHVTHEGGGHWRSRGEHHDGQEHRSKDDSGVHASAKLEPNLTISISRDGEFKSVKVTSPPIIGSGRVGPRQPAKPQFQFHSGPGDHNQPSHGGGGGGGHHQHLPLTASVGRKDAHASDHFNRNAAGRKSDRVGGESAKKSGPANGKGGSGGSQKSSSSVQDRLNRNRTAAIASTQPVSGAAKATLKTISKIIEKNAEIDEKLARELARENEKLASKVKELRLQQEQ